MCSATLVPTFSRTLRRCVLGWLLLAMAAAWAAPLIEHGRLDLVCSGSGQMRLVQLGDDDGAGGNAGSPSGLDCPNCLLLGPLPSPGLWQPAMPLTGPGLADASRPPAPLTFRAAPPPARGPPNPRFH